MAAHGMDQAFEEIGKLARDFQEHSDHYLSPAYQEAEVRKGFLDKFFYWLGWDVNHDEQRNPFEQEVKVENRDSAGATCRHVDYAFHIAPNFRDPRMVVEAKKPSAELATPDNYFQAIRYGWSFDTRIAVLTDFARLHLLDCRFEPDIESVIYSHVKRYSLEDYLHRETFDQIYWLISREAVANKSLDKFADSLGKRKRGTRQQQFFPAVEQRMDESFLSKLDGYRETLARAFKNSNHELDGETLTEITQRTIDRLVFMRFLEDKLIEPSHFVKRFGSRGNSAWHDFVAASSRLDGTYNGIVFKKHDILDGQDFPIDDEAFAAICDDLSHEYSPYNFNTIPIHILGSIYERFLGNIIVATAKRVRVEPKIEVRHAGGVYYTPADIVRYIVAQTVGTLIEGKTPEQVATMRFADIACGSGSFLLGVYDLLLLHHAKYYNDNPRKARKNDCISKDGLLYLTLEKKREILLNNIYGVDVDPQAVEVTQLSLYLKLLDEETVASAYLYQKRIHAAILPSLNSNIICGNSLIGTSILDNTLFAGEEERKLNPMNFVDAFPAIMKAGGFDAVVGNPPYVNAWELFSTMPAVREFINSGTQYTTADRHWDLYVLFLERALQITKPSGKIGYIIPFSYAIQKYAAPSRKMLLHDTTIESIADLRTVKVFHPVPVITIIPVMTKTPAEPDHEVAVIRPHPDSTPTRVSGFVESHTVPQSLLLSQNEHMLRLDITPAVARLLRKIKDSSLMLGDLCYINYGAQMSSKIKGRFGKGHVIRTEQENEHCRPMISGKELYRYSTFWSGRYVDWSFAAQMYGPRWPEFFELPKLMIRDITGTHRIEATLDRSGLYCDHTILCALRKCDVSQWKEASADDIALSQKYDIRFLAGIVASKLISAYFYLVLTGEGVRTGGGFHTYPHTIQKFPIFQLDNANREHLKYHKRLVELVDQALDAKSKASSSRTDKDKRYYEQKGVSLDRQIDAFVYELYGLTDGEIRIVEEATTQSDGSRTPAADGTRLLAFDD